MQKLTDEQKAEQELIAARDKAFNEKFDHAFKEKFEFNHNGKKITPAKSNITGFTQLQREREGTMKFGSALLNTNESISFPGSNSPTIGVSPKNSKDEYLSDGDYSLKDGTNFTVTNGIVSNVADVKSQKKAAETKLAKAQAEVIRLRSENADPRYNAFKEIYGELLTMTLPEFEKLNDQQIEAIHTKLVPLRLKQLSKAQFSKPAPTVKLSLLDQILAERGWKE